MIISSIYIYRGKNANATDLIIDSDYALDLEYGTSKMRSRPFIIRSVKEALNSKLPEIFKRFTNLLDNSPGSYSRLLAVYRNRRSNRRRTP